MRRIKLMASALAVVLAVTSVCVPGNSADAAKKVKLNKKSVDLEAGKTVKISVKNGKKSAKVKWKSSKKSVARITKKSTKGNKAYARVKAVKKGTAKITAAYKLGKKTTKLTCTVKVGVADDNTAVASPSVAPAPGSTVTTAPASPTGAATETVAPTKAPDAEQSAKPTATTKPRVTRSPRPSATPTPTPEPQLVNPMRVDLSKVNIIGENGGSAEYNAETGTIDSAMPGIQGFILGDLISENIEKYPYVRVTYSLEGGDVNAYIADSEMTGDGKGQDAAGWSEEIKLNQYTMGEGTEETLLFGTKEIFGKKDDYIKALKFFNFGEDTSLSIKAITFFMDGRVNPQESFKAAYTNNEVTVDGIDDIAEGWADANEYNFVSKVSLEGGVVSTDTAASARFMYDDNNFYFFVYVTDSSIDNTSANNYERDGLEILFDEDCCKQEGANSSDWGEVNKDGFHYRATGLDAKSEVKEGLDPSTAAIQGGGTDGAKKTGIVVKYALTDTGYTMEGMIPFAGPKAGGEKIGLDLIVQDCKGGVRYNELYLTATDEAKVYWNNTSANFGAVDLVEHEAVNPDTPENPDTPDVPGEPIVPEPGETDSRR
ncbi:MAG: Ig-like domain-containing protein [Lachnoclostridium sp.]|nr:Ig-like domain-containing protein [Lachnoclostridium sp.]